MKLHRVEISFYTATMWRTKTKQELSCIQLPRSYLLPKSSRNYAKRTSEQTEQSATASTSDNLSHTFCYRNSSNNPNNWIPREIETGRSTNNANKIDLRRRLGVAAASKAKRLGTLRAQLLVEFLADVVERVDTFVVDLAAFPWQLTHAIVHARLSASCGSNGQRSKITLKSNLQ